MESVSYTHLDVYKRQVLDSALPLQIITQEELKREGISSAEQMTMLLTANGTGTDNLASQTDVSASGSPSRGFNGASTANLRGQGSVSYTHLDVYKRQMYWDPRILAGDYFGGTKRQNGFAKFDLGDIYAELRAPVLSDLPFIKRLDIEGAYRISQHSQAGTYNNSKIGFNWQIDDNVRFRGSKQTVFRAQNVGELWGVVGASILNRTVGNVNDICTNPTTTVSYTHLDVYKRQIIRYALFGDQNLWPQQ